MNTILNSKRGRKVSIVLNPICGAAALNPNADANLWVAYNASNPTRGTVFAGTATRDEVRSSFRRVIRAKKIDNVRAMRLSNYRKLIASAI
jgi:hypothetical protein